MDVHLHPTSRFFVLILSALAALGIFSTSIYLPSMPAIGHDLGASQSAVQLTLTYFFLGSSIGQLFLGPLSDRFGRLPIAYFGLAIFIASSFWCAITNDIDSLQVGRFFQGVAASTGTLIARATARDLMSGPALTRTMSTIMMVISISPAVAPILGAFLQTTFDWHANFYALMIFGLSVGILVWGYLPETRTESAHTSHVTIVGALRNYGTLLKNKTFVAYTLMLGSQFAAMFCFITMSPYVFMHAFGWPPEYYPVVSIVMALGNICGFSIVRHLALRISANQGILWGVAIGLGVNIFLAMTLWLEVISWSILLLYAGLFMIGNAFTAANSSSASMTLFPHMAGSASALIGSVQIGSGAFGSAVAGLVEDDPLGILLSVISFVIMGFLLWAILLFLDQKKDHLAH